jgi:hypothetical protein
MKFLSVCSGIEAATRLPAAWLVEAMTNNAELLAVWPAEVR